MILEKTWSSRGQICTSGLPSDGFGVYSMRFGEQNRDSYIPTIEFAWIYPQLYPPITYLLLPEPYS